MKKSKRKYVEERVEVEYCDGSKGFIDVNKNREEIENVVDAFMSLFNKMFPEEKLNDTK